MKPIKLKPTDIKISAKLLANINKTILDNKVDHNATYLTLNLGTLHIVSKKVDTIRLR